MAESTGQNLQLLQEAGKGTEDDDEDLPSAGTNMEHSDERKVPSLHVAAADAGEDPFQDGPNYETSDRDEGKEVKLQPAAAHGQAGTGNVLPHSGVSVENPGKETPIHLTAANRGQADAGELLQGGPNNGNPDEAKKGRLSLAAAQEGQSESDRELLPVVPDIEHPDESVTAQLPTAAPQGLFSGSNVEPPEEGVATQLPSATAQGLLAGSDFDTPDEAFAALSLLSLNCGARSVYSVILSPLLPAPQPPPPLPARTRTRA